MSLSVGLNQKIVEFLTSLPNLHDINSLRAFVLSAGIDIQLQNQVKFIEPPTQFFQLLVPTLLNFGRLEDGRNALEAVLESAKRYVGSDKKEYCDILIQELCGVLNDIDFVNRFDEKEAIKSSFCPPYLLINAPTGYGKTRLLKMVQEELKHRNCLCVYLSFYREQTYHIKDLPSLILQQIGKNQSKVNNEIIPGQAGYVVSRHLLDNLQEHQKVVILLVDGAEVIGETMAKQFLNNFIPTIEEGLKIAADKSIRLRFICAGRYISQWEQWGAKIPIKSWLLTPFNFEAVHETVSNFDSKSKFTRSYKHDFAAHLMYFTGGHPGCMAKIIREDFGLSIGMIISKENEYYETTIRPIIGDIKVHISDELQDIFDILSIVRQFNSRFLRQLIDKMYIKWEQGDEYNLEIQLLKTYLINKKNGYLQDDITRRILEIHFRRSSGDLDHYLKICEEAIAFYRAELKDLKSHIPVMLSVELLFQELKYCYYTQTDAKKIFFEKVPVVLKMLVSKRYAKEVLDSLIECLKNDWEFQFTYNYLLQENSYDNEIFSELIEWITSFMQALQGENNA